MENTQYSKDGLFSRAITNSEDPNATSSLLTVFGINHNGMILPGNSIP